MNLSKRLIHSILRLTGIQASRISPCTNDEVALATMLNYNRVDLILDVGANTGQYAKRRIAGGYAGRIVSFEPLSSPRAALLKEAADYSKWDIAERCAIGDHNGCVTMQVSKNSVASSVLTATTAHLRYAPRAVKIGTEIVEMVRLDQAAQSYLAGSQYPFLKIDVQGFEDQVIAGAAKILSRIVGIELELSLVRMYEGQKLFPEMLSLIAGMGFVLYRLMPEWMDRQTGRWLQANGVFFRS